MIDTFEPGDTQQFTFTSSTAPDAAPSFALYTSSETIVASLTSATSDTTHYYAMFTMPGSEGIYVGEWKALSTVTGSAYNFVKRQIYNVAKTRGTL